MDVRVLIVDDSADFRLILRTRLEKMGCRVVAEAENAVQGLVAFREVQPDLVTLDLIMPEHDRFTAKELMFAIRRENPEVAIMVISSQSRNTNAHGFLVQGAIGYLEKCFGNFAEMPSLIQRHFPNLRPRRSGGLMARINGEAS